MKIIDAELFINLELYDAEREEWYTERMTIEECLDRYADEGCPPTIDAVEVVRCRDCKHSEVLGKSLIRYCDHSIIPMIRDDDSYCSCGERRTE